MVVDAWCSAAIDVFDTATMTAGRMLINSLAKACVRSVSPAAKTILDFDVLTGGRACIRGRVLPNARHEPLAESVIGASSKQHSDKRSGCWQFRADCQGPRGRSKAHDANEIASSHAVSSNVRFKARVLHDP